MEPPRPERAWFEPPTKFLVGGERARAEVSERARRASERLLKITFWAFIYLSKISRELEPVLWNFVTKRFFKNCFLSAYRY